MVRASVSSFLATVLDGAVYQVLLTMLPGVYAVAALGGALAGAVTNFSINRWWTFGAKGKGLGQQAFQYALVSLMTYGVLQMTLILLIEVLGVHERAAWLPAKAVAWLLVSYPLQRFLVFSDLRWGARDRTSKA